MQEQTYVQDQLSLMNNCWRCINGDAKCYECQEDFDNSQTILAHKIVDEGNMQYRRLWMLEVEQPSGHDWVAPLVRTDKGERQEFLEPVVHMEDRYFDPTLELARDEKICTWCHLACLACAKCPNCDTDN